MATSPTSNCIFPKFPPPGNPSFRYPKTKMYYPHSRLVNTPTVSYIMKESSKINLVVFDLLCTCALHSCQQFIRPFILYHPGPKNVTPETNSHLVLFTKIFSSHSCLQFPHKHTMLGLYFPCFLVSFTVWYTFYTGRPVSGLYSICAT